MLIIIILYYYCVHTIERLNKLNDDRYNRLKTFKNNLKTDT